MYNSCEEEMEMGQTFFSSYSPVLLVDMVLLGEEVLRTAAPTYQLRIIHMILQ